MRPLRRRDFAAVGLTVWQHVSRFDPDARAIRERDFQALVLDLARATGWLAYHTWLSVHSAAGFPDLVLARGGCVIFVELKRDRGKLSLAQEEWRARLGECPGVEYYLWRPSDWPAIVARLGEGRVEVRER